MFDDLYNFPRKRRAFHIASKFPTGKLLDIGCERGIMLSELIKKGWEVRGTQISENAIAYSREVLGADVP